MGEVININQKKEAKFTGEVELTDETQALIQSLSVIVKGGETNYYFMPFWFEATNEPGVYRVHHLDGKLPEELVQALHENRK